MLTYGFIYNDNPNPYVESDGCLAVLVTDTGVVLSGDATSVTTETSEIALGPVMLRQQSDRVDAKHGDLSQRFGEAVHSTRIYQLDDGLTNSGIISEFIEAVSAGQGRRAQAADFVKLVGLEAETQGGRDVADETKRMHAPHSEAAPLNADYMPRCIGGVQDVEVLRRARTAHMPVLLSGAPGTGKTTLASAAFGEELITVSCHEGMRREDLVGQWMPVPDQPGSFEWVDGPLVTAMLEGRPFLVDDIGWAAPEVQASMLPVGDDRRSITVLDRPDQAEIKAVKGFSLVLTQNPDMGVGIIEPLLSRVAFEVHVPTDLATAEALGVDPDFLAVAYRLEQEAETAESQGSSGWVPSIRDLLDATRIQQLFGTEFAASSFLAACPIDQPEYRQRVFSLLKAQLGADSVVSDGLRSER